MISVMVPPGVISKALLELSPVTKTLPDESVATPPVPSSIPLPPVLSMISVIIPPGVILKALSEPNPVTKTLPDESVAIPLELASGFPIPSPVLSMISAMVHGVPLVEQAPGVSILKAKHYLMNLLQHRMDH